MLQNKKTTVQSYRKILNTNTKNSPVIEVALFDCTREMRMDNSVTNMGKKIMVYVRLQLNHAPSPYTTLYAFSWSTPAPIQAYYFINVLLCHFTKVTERGID